MKALAVVCVVAAAYVSAVVFIGRFIQFGTQHDEEGRN